MLSRRKELESRRIRRKHSYYGNQDSQARQSSGTLPVWAPGTRQAHHAISLGYYESELMRRVGPQHRSLGQFFQDEIATPLGLDFYIRLPESIPNSRLATLARPSRAAMLLGFPIRLTLAVLNPRANIVRALPGSLPG